MFTFSIHIHNNTRIIVVTSVTLSGSLFSIIDAEYSDEAHMSVDHDGRGEYNFDVSPIYVSAYGNVF